MENIESETFILRDAHGDWLAQIVLTEDGMFAAVSEWGNFAFAWRGIATHLTFKEFLSGIDEDYFGGKMAGGYAYVTHNNKVDKAAHKFAIKILPALKNYIKENIA